MSLINRILDVPAQDPEVRRKAHFLNICLAAVEAGAILLFLVNLYELLVHADPTARSFAIYSAVGVLGGLLTYWLNRRGFHRLAGYAFLLLIVYIITAATQPASYIFEGSTILAYVLPILIASFILEPYSSAVITTVISIVLLIVARSAGITEDPTPETLATLYMLAVVSWLSAHNLNQALRQARERAEELRVINLELDQRVAERTRDLQQANRDLTRALQREHAEASKNQAILSSIADGVIVFDQQRQAVVANPAVEDMLVTPLHAILGKPIEQLIDITQDQEKIPKLINTAFNSQISTPVRFKFEQGQRIISTSLASVSLPDQQRGGVVAVFHDVTREVEANRAKSEFVSNVSHELRTPLTSIKGYTDLLFMEAAGMVNERQRNFLRTIKSNAERLTALLNDLLEISRMETGRIRLDVGDVDLAHVIQDAADSLRPQMEEKGLDLVVDVDSNLPTVRGDERRLNQVITNLLSNAHRYTPAGGQVKVEGHRTKEGVQVDVADTGIGIAPKDRSRLFQRFFRANDPRVNAIGGTGLGLAISKMFVELHGGRIWVESELDEGSTFSFLIPTAKHSLPSQESLLEQSPIRETPNLKAGAGQQVLVVDDEENIADLIEYYLQDAGYQVTVVNRGRDVLPTAQAQQPDMILLDILLPDMNGFQVLRELKDNPVTAAIPVLILSVLHDKETGFRLGAADYLNKPINAAELLSGINQILTQAEDQESTHVLVVDDEADIRDWIEEVISGSGFEVRQARNGVEALQAVSESQPDLILLDLKMPGLDGRTVIKNLKSDKRTCDIPIVVLTASPINKEQEAAQLLGLGAKQFLTKPIAAQALMEEIKKHLITTPDAQVEPTLE
jgi:PAS domain S-box-containing protein